MLKKYVPSIIENVAPRMKNERIKLGMCSFDNYNFQNSLSRPKKNPLDYKKC